MARAYTFIIPGLASLTTVPFAQLAPPSTTGIEITRIELGQEAATTSQQLIMTIMRRSTASTLPTTVTPAALWENDPASLLTGSTTTNAVGIATVTGTAGNILHRVPFNGLNGWVWTPSTPQSTIKVKPGGFLTLQFLTAPPADTWSGYIEYVETD